MKIPPPPPLRSGYLDLKDAQYAETKDVQKKIISYIAFLSYGRPKRSKKCAIFSKVTIFAGKIQIDLKMIFYTNIFFLRDSYFFNMQSIVVMIVFTIYKCLQFTQCYDRSYCIHEFFLCDSQFLSYCQFCILQQLTATQDLNEAWQGSSGAWLCEICR